MIQALMRNPLADPYIIGVSAGASLGALILPHAVRLLVGADHRRVLPAAALLGALFLVWVDVGACMVLRPSETPSG